MINNQPWPKEQEDELRRLYLFRQDGFFLSHSLIAVTMQTRYPTVTRGSVIGKIKRLKLERDQSVPYMTCGGQVIDPQITNFKAKTDPMTRLYNGPRAKSSAPRAPTGAGEYVGEMSPMACQVVELTDATCHFPIGHVGQEGFHFCGAWTDGVYCDIHAKICYQPPKPRHAPYVSGNKY